MLQITRPTLLLDKQRALANIQKMASKAQRNQVDFRPHFKTHQSHEIGRWFRDYGVTKIAVSSLKMAEYFAEDGWNDITVAIPVNILEINTINKLASKIKLHLLVQSLETLSYLETNLTSPVQAFIKIDLGYGRTGVSIDKLDFLDSLTSAIQQSKMVNFVGFLGHAGHSYQACGLAQITAVHQESMDIMSIVYTRYKNKFPQLCISVGDTPTCSRMDSFGCVTELRPGNFIYYDLIQEQIGSCQLNQIAVAVACPIIALHPERNELIIYGGGVHFSKDVYEHAVYGTCYGLVVYDDNNNWSSPIPNVFLSKISQEHGVVKCPVEFLNQCQIGDLLKILPVHSCMTADLLKEVVLVDSGERVSMMK